MSKAKIKAHCPDGGYCHHQCAEHSPDECFRVACCAPLSAAYPSGEWPAEVLMDPRPFFTEIEATE